jgi:hypothetical protein
MGTERNWAGNLTYGQARLERPADIPALQELVAGASSVRALGSRHSFNDIADTTGTLVSLENLRPAPAIDSASGRHGDPRLGNRQWEPSDGRGGHRIRHGLR